MIKPSSKPNQPRCCIKVWTHNKLWLPVVVYSTLILQSETLTGHIYFKSMRVKISWRRRLWV